MKPKERTCPNCEEPFTHATGPNTIEDAKIMVANQLHLAGLCKGSLDKAFDAYEKLFGKRFGE